MRNYLFGFIWFVLLLLPFGSVSATSGGGLMNVQISKESPTYVLFKNFYNKVDGFSKATSKDLLYGHLKFHVVSIAKGYLLELAGRKFDNIISTKTVEQVATKHFDKAFKSVPGAMGSATKGLIIGMVVDAVIETASELAGRLVEGNYSVAAMRGGTWFVLKEIEVAISSGGHTGKILVGQTMLLGEVLEKDYKEAKKALEAYDAKKIAEAYSSVSNIQSKYLLASVRGNPSDKSRLYNLAMSAFYKKEQGASDRYIKQIYAKAKAGFAKDVMTIDKNKHAIALSHLDNKDIGRLRPFLEKTFNQAEKEAVLDLYDRWGEAPIGCANEARSSKHIILLVKANTKIKKFTARKLLGEKKRFRSILKLCESDRLKPSWCSDAKRKNSFCLAKALGNKLNEESFRRGVMPDRQQAY